MAFDLDDDELRATREMLGLEKIEDLNEKIIDRMAKFIDKQDINESILENAKCCICGKEIKGVKKCENYACNHCYNLIWKGKKEC